jgi:hypothetical protein
MIVPYNCEINLSVTARTFPAGIQCDARQVQELLEEELVKSLIDRLLNSNYSVISFYIPRKEHGEQI